jgi:predicted ATPase
VTLKPLGIADASLLVSSMLDNEPISAEFAAFVYDNTDGLPLLIEESVRLLHDRADLIRRDGQWVQRSLGELQVTPMVRDAVVERLDRLLR